MGRGLDMDITIRDIAKYAGVSPATVSRVMNNTANVSEATRMKVLEAIEKHNYSPNIFAQGLSTNESNTIGVVVPDVTNPFFGEVIKGISEVVDRHNLNMILCDTDENSKKEKRHLINLKSQKLKGLVITPTSDTDRFNLHYLNLLRDMGIPIALIDRDVKNSDFDGVFIDNIKGGFDATTALLQNGHERIALIAGPDNSKPGRDRKRGYIKAFETAGIPLNKAMIFDGDFKLNSGYELTKKILMMEHRATAIFSSNNMMTLGCIKALNEYGYVISRDISLISFDELETLNILGIKLSAIRRPTVEMGRIAMELLIKRISQKSQDFVKTKKIILEPQLILRGSEKNTHR